MRLQAAFRLWAAHDLADTVTPALALCTLYLCDTIRKTTQYYALDVCGVTKLGQRAEVRDCPWSWHAQGADSSGPKTGQERESWVPMAHSYTALTHDRQ
jgi:hypothetical protein